ncbi:MAG: SDR family oxidoreductase [Rhodospirillales bacterium]|nr:MAG: SDR family oxidoreductase [Rhodospirillales bacterium]
MSNILVIGASKGIGLEATRRALACGHSVRALARSADRIAIDDQRLEKRVGDARNRDDVAAALDGIDVVIQALGVATGPDLFIRPIHLFSDSTRVLVLAMEAAGVKRLICVTGFGAGDSRASLGCLQSVPFRLFLGRAYDDKSVQERLIRDSSLDWVIARPVILTRGPRTGRYKVLDDPASWRNGLISRADVADFLIRQVEDDTYLGKTPVLTY